MDADTTVGGVASSDNSLVESDATPGQSHPVGHACSDEFPAGGNGGFARIGTAVHDSTAGVVDFPVEV